MAARSQLLSALALVGVVSAVAAPGTQAPAPGTSAPAPSTQHPAPSTPDSAALWHHRNLGKAFYENPTTQQQAVDEFKKALELAPNSARERLNYGLALLRAAKTADAITELQKVQQQDPSIPHTWFNLGIAYKKDSQYDKAIVQFEQMVKLAPNEPISHYNLGYLYKLTEKPAEALREFERASQLDANLAGPHFQLFNAYRDAGRADEAQREQQTFQEIKRRQAGAAIPEDLDWSAYAEILETLDPSLATDPAPPAALKFTDRKPQGTEAAADPDHTGLLVLDADGDGKADLIAWTPSGVRLLKNGESVVAAAGLGEIRGARSIAAGDYNNDGFPDLCVITDEGAALYTNTRGTFARAAATLPPGSYARAVFVDYDHDYDADLILLGDSSKLLRNNGQAGFSDQTAEFPFAAGRAVDAVAFDFINDTSGHDLIVSYADHPGVLYRDLLAGKYRAEPVAPLAAGARSMVAQDIDYDGWLDLVAAGPAGALVLINKSGRFEAAPAPGTPAPGTAPGTPAPAPSTQHPAPGTRSTPWFAWIHLYDPHEPYDAPEPYRSRYASDPYAGEVAYADAALGSFLATLRARHALDRTVVVITSDHGEALGDHGEQTHGLFAYESTLRVPLIMWGDLFKPSVVSVPARLVDVMPSLLDLVGVAGPSELDGRTLLPLIGTPPANGEQASYFEALNANLTRNWAPLKGVTVNNLKLIDLPLPELYDLAADSGESRNLYASQRDRARPLEALLDAAGAKPALPSATAPIDADAEARLRSLGYVVGGTSRPAKRYTADDDPKRLVHLHVALDRAVAEWSVGRSAEAVDTLRTVIRERPDLTVAYDRLAFILRASGRLPEAIALVDDAARKGYADSALLRTLASMHRDAGNLARSAAILEPLVKKPADSGVDPQTLDALAQTYARMGRGADAEALFRRVLNASPSAASTWTNLGALYLTQNRDAEAIDALSRAVAINPTLAGAHNALGVAYIRRGDRQRAVAEWQEALRIRPDFADARANLGRVGAR